MRAMGVVVVLSACVPQGGFDAGVPVVVDAGAPDAGALVDAGATPGWTLRTFAGTGVAGAVNGPAAMAQFNEPAGLALDADGALYVADKGNRSIRRIDASGAVSTVASSGLVDPSGVAVGRNGTLYVSDTSEQCVRSVSAIGRVEVFAGTCVLGQMGFTRCYDSGPGTVGPGVFGGPSGVAADLDAGVLYVADTIYETVRVAPIGRRELATLAGTNGVMGARDGACGRNFCCGTSANFMGCTAMQGTSFRRPVDVALASDGALLVVDRDNCAVRRIAGPGDAATCRSTTVFGGVCAAGSPPESSLRSPLAIAAGHDGVFFVSDTGRQRVVRIDPSRPAFDRLEALPGAGTFTPWGLAVDVQGRVFVADSANHRILVFEPPL
jgi:DNA-binding beta-propeller fold protein YncE